MSKPTDLLLSILHRLVNAPIRLRDRVAARYKAASCVLGKEAKLHATSQIENNQQHREAIVIGAKSNILGRLLVLRHGGTIQIGESCFIGEGTHIWSACSITIGDRVLVSHNVNIHDNNSHSFSALDRQVHINAIFTTGHPKQLDDVSSAPIVIEDDAWIGFNATILQGVTIGRGAIVGAHTMVLRDVPAYSIVFGNPARLIGEAMP